MAVAYEGARVQDHPGQLAYLRPGNLASEPADNSYADAGRGALVQEPNHGWIADLRVIEQKFLLGRFDKGSELLSRIQRTDYERSEDRRVRLASAIGLKQPYRFLYEFLVHSDDAEAAASHDVQVSKIEGEQIELAAINDHQFAVIAEQFVAGT